MNCSSQCVISGNSHSYSVGNKCLKFAFLSEGYRLYIYVTFTSHLSPCNSMVRASHWSSEGYRLYTYMYVTFTSHLSPCTFSSMVRASHWSSEGYRLYTYVLKIMYSGI